MAAILKNGGHLDFFEWLTGFYFSIWSHQCLCHAFTGCDVVSAFRGKGKSTAWQTWDVYPEATDLEGMNKI